MARRITLDLDHAEDHMLRILQGEHVKSGRKGTAVEVLREALSLYYKSYVELHELEDRDGETDLDCRE